MILRILSSVKSNAAGSLVALLAASALAMSPATAEEVAPATDLVVNEASSLDELLDNVRERRVVESRENAAREARFVNEKDQQARFCLLYTSPSPRDA